LNLETFFVTELSVDGGVIASRLPLTDERAFPNTLIWVHGNQIPPREAVRRGLMVYDRLKRNCASPDSMRFVIWSWPSERTTGRIRDVQEKSLRTDVESFLLASYLSQASDGGPISILGYSFGARIIAGALHLSSGGALEGYQVPQLAEPAEPYRVALFAAAVANDAMLRGGRYQYALSNVEYLLLQNNSRDRALNLYWITNLRTKPTALGDGGLPCAPPNCQVHQYDWARCIGREHSLNEYVNRPAIMRRVAHELTR
jgi:hypothetical protein